MRTDAADMLKRRPPRPKGSPGGHGKDSVLTNANITKMRGLPRQVKAALEKARDSAILAVEVYNKPAVKFKSGGYITLIGDCMDQPFACNLLQEKDEAFSPEIKQAL